MALLFASLGMSWTATGLLDAQTAIPPQSSPLFRGGVSLIELDVSVLDKKRRPIKGLTAADFIVLDEGQPRKVVAFSSVDVPDAETQSETWMRTTTPDVTNNQFADRRLVVILISDLMMDPLCDRDGPGLAANEMMKTLAHTVVHDLGPTDLASVEYVYHRGFGQPFTADRAKLDEAVDRFEPIILRCVPEPIISALVESGLPARDLMGALNQTISALGTMPDRRKLVFLVDDGSDLDASTSGRDQLYRAAQRANVTLNTLDPDGLVAIDTRNPRGPRSLDPHQAARERVVEMAHNTGGEAVVNTNDPASAVPGIFRENQSYYLLGFEAEPGTEAGLSRRVEVKVNRPDVEVLARHAYYTSGPGASTPSRAPVTAAEAVASPLPIVSFPLEVAVAPFAGVARPVPSAEITLHVMEPGVAWSRNEVLQIEARAYSADGHTEVQQNQTVRWAPQLGKAGDREGTTVLGMDLSPGYHELRVAVRSAALAATASVFAEVEVPDFASEPVSLSGVVIAAGSSEAAVDAPSNPMAVSPTTSRTFVPSDRVRALLSIYQGSRGQVASVTVTTRVYNERNDTVFEHSETVAADHFITSNRRADWAVDLPLSRLTPGAYLLTIETRAGTKRAQRDLTFRVRQ